jgi:uncharacterized protein HemX
VHLTEATKLECKGDLPEFLLRPGNQDSYLREKNIKTYLLKATDSVLDHLQNLSEDYHQKKRW